MTRDSLSNLHPSIAYRIIERLDGRGQAALMQTCKALRDVTRDSRQAELLRQSRRPGRISNDPFPTLLEHVHRGAQVHYRNRDLPGLLRACAGLPRGDGILQAAARRRLRARIEGRCVTWNQGCYAGRTDRSGRPHGTGLYFSCSADDLRRIYIGDWCHGRRAGYGIQFFWKAPPGSWDPAQDDGDDASSCGLTGGWYEGQWRNDQYAGMGLLFRPDEVYREGRWKDGQPV